MIDFIVLGLPRSGTTWLANWLTTDRSLCLHDPFNDLPEDWPRDSRRFGISCTGAYLMPAWLAEQKCPIAVIVRDRKQCEASAEAIGVGGDMASQQNALFDVPGFRLAFECLWNEDVAQDLWSYLLPDIPFDPIRYRLLRSMNIQPHNWQFNETTARELVSRGYFRST